MRHIYQISNEASPGTPEPWYEVNDTRSEGSVVRMVAIFYTKDELDIYLSALTARGNNWVYHAMENDHGSN